MNDLQIFTNEDFGTVRSVEINGAPWFVAQDITSALGYKNPRQAISTNVEVEDKGVHIMDTLGGTQEMTIINESGLYSLILRSQLPDAKKFKHWVTSEVLPSIRKTGSYQLGSYQIEDPIERAHRWIEEEKERQALKLTVSVQSQQLAELQPKASYYDIVLSSPDLISTTEIAKDYGWSAQRLNEFLNNHRIQYKVGGTWVLYQKYAEQGYTSTKTHAHPAPDGSIHTSIHTYWTQKGRLFIYDLLKSEGILPIIEVMNIEYCIGRVEV